MKNKLTAIREALGNFPDINDGRIDAVQHHGGVLEYRWGDFFEALSLLDEVLAEMDSMELVEKVAKVLRMDLTDRSGIQQAIEACDDDIQEEIFTTNAQAAINTIKGEIA